MSVARRAVLIAGPTASGKSALALERAERSGGVIINTDAMQVYDVLSVLTARPGARDIARAPHLLYGAVSPASRYSTGDWQRAVQEILRQFEDEGRELIFVGGTGLYFEALTAGVAQVPEIPAEITADIQSQVDMLDREGRARLIAQRDPEMARRLAAPDPQRVVRALSVLKATGRSLASFQDEGQAGLLEGFTIERIVLNPDRDVLRERIARRFALIVEQGAVEEVRALLSLNIDPGLPAMKAIGVTQIRDWLAGRLTREEAVGLAVIATRQYAKRQRTWFRNRMGDWRWIDPLSQAQPS